MSYINLIYSLNERRIISDVNYCKYFDEILLCIIDCLIFLIG